MQDCRTVVFPITQAHRGTAVRQLAPSQTREVALKCQYDACSGLHGIASSGALSPGLCTSLSDLGAPSGPSQHLERDMEP